jgi:hypothetical protein
VKHATETWPALLRLDGNDPGRIPAPPLSP